MVKNILYFVLLILHPIISSSQRTANEGGRIVDYQALPVPLTPNAASLGKFGAVPVNAYTGLPSIQLPLYTVKQGTLSVPITLAYHSAIKVDETPSWVGLGWALQAGGAITQTVRGNADQSTSQGYWLNKAYVDSLSPRFMVLPHSNLPGQMASGAIDVQPDLYYYNLPFGSGQLLFTDSTHAVAIGERGIDVRFTHRRFEVTDRMGTRYILGNAESCRDYNYVESDDAQGPTRGGSGAFYVSKIISADQQDTIQFHYEREEFSQPLTPTETAYLYDPSPYAPPGIQAPAKQIASSTQHSSQCQLREIVWRQGRILFTADAKRADLTQAGNSDAHGLSQISIYTRNNELIKSYGFTYDYFYSNQYGAQPNKVDNHIYQSNEVRLKLVAITEQNGALKLPSYSFKYYEHRSIPARNSYQQDHWGFANLNTAATFLPKYILMAGGSSVKVYADGGSREPDFSSALAGVLREITYPTGGKTRFSYEPHRIQKAGSYAAIKLQATTKSLVLGTRDFTGVEDGDDVVKTATFTITQPAGASYNYGLLAQGGYGGAQAIVRLTLTKVIADNTNLNRLIFGDQAIDDGRITPGAGNVPVRASSGGSRTVNLEPGTYVLNLTGSKEAASVRAAAGSIDLTFTQAIADTSTSSLGVIVGGTRIKRIVDIASSETDSTARNYTYGSLANDGNSSSGVLVKNPIYNSSFTDYFPMVVTDNIPVTLYYPFTYTSISSSPVSGLGSTQGSHVGYGRVQISNTNGKFNSGYEVHYFTTAAQYPDISSLSPYAPPTSRDDLRGTLLRHESYSAEGQLLKRVESLYTVDPRVTNQLSGLVARRMAADHPSGTVVNDLSYSRYRFDYFREQIRWKYESKRLTTTFAATDTTQRVTQQQTFVYANPSHGQLTQLRTQLDNGKEQVQYNRYPLDYPATGADANSLGIQQLQRAHVWSPIIETSDWYKSANRQDSLLLSSKVHTYWPRTGHSTSLPDKLYTLNLPQPMATYQRPIISTAGWMMDPRYEERERYVSYDAQANPTLVTRAHTAYRHAYLWGYGGELLIGEATNCTPAQLAYTSFEPASTGRWCYDSTGMHCVPGGRTGRYAYQLDGTVSVSRDQLPVGDYELSYWVQTHTSQPILNVLGGSQLGGGAQLITTAPADWKQYRVRLRFTSVGKVSLGGTSGLLDEVRLYPVGAQLTSYTHQPLVGMTSQTTAAGRTIFYEYDGLGRLVCTRDEQDRILSQQQYHYAGGQ